MGFVEADGDTDDGNDELADDHADRAENEDSSTAEALNSPERDGGGEHIDKSEDQRHEEGVLDRAS